MKKRDLLSAIDDKRRHKYAKISDAEWLMYRDCPKEELQHCLIYEFSRESLSVKKWVNWLQIETKRNPNATVSELLSEFPNQVASEYPTRLFTPQRESSLSLALMSFPRSHGCTYLLNFVANLFHNFGVRPGHFLLATCLRKPVSLRFWRHHLVLCG